MPPLNEQEVLALVSRFVAEELLFTPSIPLNPAQPLSESGILDSTTVLELVAFIESQFAVIISLDAITSETFDTLDNITATVMAELRSHPTADTGE